MHGRNSAVTERAREVRGIMVGSSAAVCVALNGGRLGRGLTQELQVQVEQIGRHSTSGGEEEGPEVQSSRKSTG